ncbi:hypothetical protein HPB51_029554 [Rhipicephalus microplus]|uniref:Uncharacterized protein n=1 Tax=Rhipicephalus microplus TaxID=6941 RepID=A0A9J6CUM2_RHIMP|nr:hypothetical protein HPB51_029554 [Rhipicephalus microplus]
MADGMDGSATSAKRAAMLLLLDSDSSESESSSTDASDSSHSDSDAKACAYEREFNKLFRIPAKRPQVVGFIEDVVWQYSDHEHFRRHFRLARPVAEKLVAEFAVSSMCPSSTHGGVQAKSAETHVLTFIWYAANKTGMRDVASRFDMSESTVYRVLQRVEPFLMTLGPSVIKFPADLENLTSSFEVSLENIKKACELDAKHQLKLLPHLKLRNLDPSHFEKMNLATAHALFHHAIAAGLRVEGACYDDALLVAVRATRLVSPGISMPTDLHMIVLKEHCSTTASRRLLGVPVAFAHTRVKAKRTLWERRADDATRMFINAAEGHGRKTATVKKVNMRASMGAVFFRMNLTMSSSCALWPYGHHTRRMSWNDLRRLKACAFEVTTTLRRRGGPLTFQLDIRKGKTLRRGRPPDWPGNDLVVYARVHEGRT